MRSLERCEGLWRDGLPKQMVYAVLIAGVIIGSVYLGFVQPKQERIRYLARESVRVSSMPHQYEKVAVKDISIPEKACPWEKGDTTRRMTGAFSSVYDCVMQEESTRAVSLMRLQKNALGVSVVLGFNEMPA